MTMNRKLQTFITDEMFTEIGQHQEAEMKLTGEKPSVGCIVRRALRDYLNSKKPETES
ncbi:hypothetical protein [Sulfuricurvum sp.]|uniref:hypothetical protein n=1 Tax=Sulfuricurvum sp. TaxID=2025608 RepID=UPI0035692C30